MVSARMKPCSKSVWITPAACGARDAGKFRLEGKDYVVQDGDVMHFRFNA